MMAARIHILMFTSALLLGHCAQASDPAPSTNAPAPSAYSFESFRIIADRNIFNQNRSPKTARAETPRIRPTPVIHALSLVGTMSFEKGDFAFFDGTRPEFKKPVKEGEKIAGYEVKEISPNGVKIANETNQFEIKVGQQLRREDESEWQLSTSPRPIQPAVDDSNAGADPAAASGSEDEALKRLMEKRAKELNQ